MEEQDTLKPKRKSKKLLVFVTIFGTITIVGLSVLAYFSYFHTSVPQPSDQVLQSIGDDVALYYPKKLPEGFEAQPETITGQVDNSDLITYRISYGNENQLFVSVQPIPNDFDFVGFYKQTIRGEEFEASNGEAYIGSLNNNSVVSLKTNDAWILLNAPGGVGANELKEVARNLHRVN